MVGIVCPTQSPFDGLGGQGVEQLNTYGRSVKKAGYSSIKPRILSLSVCKAHVLDAILLDTSDFVFAPLSS